MTRMRRSTRSGTDSASGDTGEPGHPGRRGAAGGRGGRLDYRGNPSIRRQQVEDAWAAAPATGAGKTYPAVTPVKRIDYVTASDEVRVVATEVPETTASDHLPVVADLVVRRGR